MKNRHHFMRFGNQVLDSIPTPNISPPGPKKRFTDNHRKKMKYRSTYSGAVYKPCDYLPERLR